jgi:hypothetical protein
MNYQELDLMVAELEQENRLLRARNDRLEVEQHLQALHDENVRLGLYEQEHGEPVAQLEKVLRYEPEIFREDRIRMELDSLGEWVKYADVATLISIPPSQQEQGEPVLWAAKESMFMWGKSDESGHPYHIVCKGKKVKSHQIPLYTTPQQLTWVGLTPEQVAEFETWHDNREEEVGWCNPSEIVAYIEAKLKEKNT